MQKKDEKIQLAKEVLLHMYQIADEYRRQCSRYKEQISGLERAIEEKDKTIKGLLEKNSGIEMLLGEIKAAGDREVSIHKNEIITKDEIIDKYLKCISNDLGERGDIGRLVKKNHSETMKEMGCLLEEVQKIERHEENRRPVCEPLEVRTFKETKLETDNPIKDNSGNYELIEEPDQQEPEKVESKEIQLNEGEAMEPESDKIKDLKRKSKKLDLPQKPKMPGDEPNDVTIIFSED